MTLTIGQNLNFAVSAADIIAALKQKSPSLIALKPSTLPRRTVTSSRPRRPRLISVDGTKSPEGKKMLADLEEITLIIASFSFDPTGRVSSYVKRMAENNADQAGLKLRGKSKAVMFVTMRFEDSGIAKGASSLVITGHVMVSHKTSKGDLVVTKVWEENQRVGTFSKSGLAKGNIPTRVRSKMIAFFKMFRDAKTAAAGATAEKKK